MLSLAVDQGLHTYVKTKLTLYPAPALMREKRVPPLLAFGLKWFTIQKVGKAPRVVKILLYHGEEPNELFDKYKSWELFTLLIIEGMASQGYLARTSVKNAWKSLSLCYNIVLMPMCAVSRMGEHGINSSETGIDYGTSGMVRSRG